MDNEQKQRVRLLVDALRSGKFKQTSNTLARRSLDGKRVSYCCLGVAIEVARANGVEVSRNNVEPGHAYLYDQRPDPECPEDIIGNESDLPTVVMNWYGFDSEDPVLKVDSSTLRPDPKYQFERDAAYIGTSRRAATCNDTVHMNFREIADAFENTFLKETEN